MTISLMKTDKPSIIPAEPSPFAMSSSEIEDIPHGDYICKSGVMPVNPGLSRPVLRRFRIVPVIILFLLLYLFTGQALADTLTGGISRVKVEDYVILIRGGIIQSVKDFTVNIWMTGLDADIRIGKNPSYFAGDEKVILPPPRLPNEISLQLSPLGLEAPFTIPVDPVLDKATELENSASLPDDSEAEAANVFTLNLMNTNSLRVVVEGDAEIFQQPENVDAPELHQIPVDEQIKSPESSQITLQAPFPVGEEISQIRISTSYSKKNHFRFVVMGDSKDGLDIYKSILRKVRNIRPLFFAHLGDIVGSGTRREYQQILRLMSQVHFPFFISIGNNDALSQGKTVYQYWLGPTYYSFSYRNSHFVFLDDSSGLIDENQFSWLRDDLQKNRSKKIFLFMHIPPYDPRQARSYEIGASQNAEWLMNLAAEFGVKRIYSSHINSYFKFTRQGIPITITGGAGSRLINKKSHHHFLLITVTGDKITERVVRIN